MRTWIDFTRNGVIFREVRSDEPPVDRCEFYWSVRIDSTLVQGKMDVSHLVILRSFVDWQELISKRAWGHADKLVNGPKREIERRRHYEDWKRRGIDAFA